MDFRVKLLVSMIESLGIGGENDYTTSTFCGVQQEWSMVWDRCIWSARDGGDPLVAAVTGGSTSVTSRTHFRPVWTPQSNKDDNWCKLCGG